MEAIEIANISCKGSEVGILDVLQLIVAILAVWVAYSGLQTWRSQIVFAKKHDIGSRVLTEASKLCDNIAASRSPIRQEFSVTRRPVFSGEDTATDELLDRADFAYYPATYLLNNQDPSRALKVLKFEAEAKLSSDVIGLIEKLLTLESEIIDGAATLAEHQLNPKFSQSELDAAVAVTHHEIDTDDFTFQLNEAKLKLFSQVKKECF